MPRLLWTHTCCGRVAYCGWERCDTCGTISTHRAWHLGMHEAMARYQYIYQLKPEGPHRVLAHRLLDPLRDTCTVCEGEGILTHPDNPEAWSGCPRCEGTGGSWIVEEARVQAARAEVLRAYPDAAAPPIPEFLGGPLIRDLARGIMIGLRRDGEV